jgi:hypothetical protein
LLVLVPLAAFPVSVAHLVWASTTLAIFLAVVFRIAGKNAVLVALLAPLTIQVAVYGQNGFATAALLGGTLLLSDRRPVLAGVLTGVLFCKPQLCLLLPLAIVVRCGWRGLSGALVSCGVMAAVSASVFGVGAWKAFFLTLHSNAAEFSQGAVPWASLQSIYGQAHALGLGSNVSIALQGALAMAVLAAILRLEAADASLALRNAAICAGTVLVTPYVLAWDLTIFGVGMAYLVQADVNKGCQPLEAACLFWIVISTQVFLLTGFSVGLLDGLLLMFLVYRRAVCPGQVKTVIQDGLG